MHVALPIRKYRNGQQCVGYPGGVRWRLVDRLGPQHSHRASHKTHLLPVDRSLSFYATCCFTILTFPSRYGDRIHRLEDFGIREFFIYLLTTKEKHGLFFFFILWEKEVIVLYIR